MGISELTGSPWHITCLKKKDDRRHKSYCIYYVRSTKFCKKIKNQCFGSMNCEWYSTSPNSKKLVDQPKESPTPLSNKEKIESKKWSCKYYDKCLKICKKLNDCKCNDPYKCSYYCDTSSLLGQNRNKWNCLWFDRKKRICAKYKKSYVTCNSCEHWIFSSYTKTKKSNSKKAKC